MYSRLFGRRVGARRRHGAKSDTSAAVGMVGGAATGHSIMPNKVYFGHLNKMQTVEVDL